MIPSNPTKEELQTLITSIRTAADTYDPTADPITDYGQRASIRGAAIDLLHAMSTPDDLTWRKLLNMTELIILRTAFRLGTFAAVPLEGSISKADLAAKVKAQESLIERSMRILVGSGMFTQTETGEYAHTKFSRSYIDTSVPGPGTFFQALYDVHLRAMVHFDEYMVETARAKGPDELYSEPTSNFYNPFVRYYGTDGQSVWDAMAAHPDVMRPFQISLKVMDAIMPPTGPFYDFSQFASRGPGDTRVQVVDVGGGYGKVLVDIVSNTPALDPKLCVLQDVQGVIDMAAAAKEKGLQTQVIDFHKEQPVKGAKAYYLRFISHDYSDADLVNILGHIAAAMAADSKLLFADTVIPDRLVEATLPTGVLDQLMFNIGGTERTEAGFRDVLARVGLELVRVCPVPGSTGAVVESVKMRS